MVSDFFLIVLVKWADRGSDLFEAKAILLGRMGRHDGALEIYVYRLQDFLKAEECVRNSVIAALH